MIVLDGIIFSLQRWGGISVYFNELINSVNTHHRISNEVVLCGSTVPSHIKASLSGINYRLIEPRCYERYRRCQISEKAQLFHSSYYRIPNKNVPIVTTVYDFTYEMFQSGPRKWVHSLQKLKAIRKSSAVICISENTRKHLLRFVPQIKPEIIHVIYLGVNESFVPLNEKQIGTQKPFVLFIGMRNGYKNFRLAVEAMTQMPQLDFVLIGGGELTLKEVKLLNNTLPKRWRYEKFVTDDQLNLLYNNAACLLYPSSHEGFGMPVLEAMRAGCPVVAFNGSSIPEVAGEAALLFDKLDPDSLAENIHRTLDSSERERLKSLGFVKASEFIWEKTFKNTVSVYEKVLGRRLLKNN